MNESEYLSWGEVAIYGSVLTIKDKAKNHYKRTIEQLKELEELSKAMPLIYIGDLNISSRFTRTSKSRKLFFDRIKYLGLKSLTEKIYSGVEHIVVSDSIVNRFDNVEIIEFSPVNNGSKSKRLSDHKMIKANMYLE